MTLRRYAPIAKSRGTVIPPAVRLEVYARDGYRCVCERAGFPEDVVAACAQVPGIELDHVRAGGTGIKSRSTPDNLVILAPVAHRWKTLNGRRARPLLLEYLASVEGNLT